MMFTFVCDPQPGSPGSNAFSLLTVLNHTNGKNRDLGSLVPDISVAPPMKRAVGSYSQSIRFCQVAYNIPMKTRIFV